MLTQTILSGIRTASLEARRSFGIIAPAMQKASDPVQQLFLDKLREYKSKSKWVQRSQWIILGIPVIALHSHIRRNDSLVDPTPEIQKELKAELERVAKVSVKWNEDLSLQG